jgi:hypothetical protein
MNTELEKAKRLVKAQLVADHAQAFHKLREKRPELSSAQALKALEVEEPELVAAARAAEEDEWPEPKPEPVYRYRPAPAAKVDLEGILEKYAPKRIQARKSAKENAELVHGVNPLP